MAAIIATVVVAFLPAARSIKWAAGAVWAYLSQPISIPLWAVLGASGLLIVMAVRALARSAKPRPPVWLSYTTDTFLETVWKWKYVGGQISSSSITPYCPVCETRLHITQEGYSMKTTILFCQECRFRREDAGNVAHIIGKVERLIEREANRMLVHKK